MPVDARDGDVANWISADDVTTTLKGMRARHVLVVSDSCYSGALARDTIGRLATPMERERYLKKMGEGMSRTLMASGGNEPVADGGGGEHSIFAATLLRGLDEMEQEVFAAEEIFFQFVRESVAGKSDQTPEYNPLRNSGHENGDFVFHRKTASATSEESNEAKKPAEAAPKTPTNKQPVNRPSSPGKINGTKTKKP